MRLWLVSLALWSLVGCVRCALLSMVSDSLLFSVADHKNLKVQPTVKNIGRRLLAPQDEPSKKLQCAMINGVCGCSIFPRCQTLRVSSTIADDQNYRKEKIFDGMVGHGNMWYSAATTGPAWASLSCPNTFFLGGFLEAKYTPAKLAGFQIWVGSDPNFPGTNTRCYQSTATASGMHVYYSEFFNCSRQGSYIYVVKPNLVGDSLEIGEGQFYEPSTISGQVIINNICSCPISGQVVINQSCACPLYSNLANNTCSCPANSILNNTTCQCLNSQQTIVNNKCSCQSGKYPVGGNCVTCPSGMICAVSFDAATCSSGSYCPEGSSTETPCQAGSYCATPSTQVQCPENTYCPESSTAPTTCPDSKVSPPGSTSLTQCEKNEVSVDFTIDGVNPSVSQSQFAADLALSNIAVNSFGEVLMSAQNVCPVGFYCPPDTTTPIVCPAGTFNNFTNKQNISDCLACPAGQFCPISSILPMDCAAGSYRETAGGVAQTSCTVCPEGSFCPVASVFPMSCFIGTYNPNAGRDKAEDCQVCDIGR